MPRQVSSRTTLPLLKQEAKRWYASLRRADPDALARLTSAWPNAPVPATLRDVQHALAREYGHHSWIALLDGVAAMALDAQGRDAWMSALLSHGWTGERGAARHVAALHPELAREHLFAAAAMGDVAEVERHLRRTPNAVTARCEVQGWSALAHVAYGRLDEQHALTIATLLLEAGADVHFTVLDDWNNPFTLLTGLAGDGERPKPPHPQAHALATLFLDRGIDPFDTQLLYNTSLHHDDLSWLELLWSHSVKRGLHTQWLAHEGRRLGGRFPGSTLDYLLGNAVLRRHERRTAWLLDYGADANARHAYSGRPVHTEARLAGFASGVALLEAHGAQRPSLSPALEFVASVLLNDWSTAQRLLAAQPSLIHTAAPLHAAALQGRIDTLSQLLALGADVHAPDHEGATALHRAVQGGAVEAARLLLSAGADIDRREPRFQDTALSWAVVLGQHEVAALLVPLSHDVRALARLGETDRLREVLVSHPHVVLDVMPQKEAPTVLFCLADDDETAEEVSQLLLSHGADSAVRDQQGHTAAEVAHRRGLPRTAARLA